MNRPYHPILLALVLVTSGLAFRCAAYSVSPGIAVLRPGRGETVRVYTLRNDGGQPAAVELEVHACHKDLEGRLVQAEDESADFLIYPAQVLVMPGQEELVQARWVGPGPIERERTYCLHVREIPVPSGGESRGPVGGTRVQVTPLVNYNVLIYVAPTTDSPPAIAVESVELLRRGDAERLVVVCRNDGTRHLNLQAMALLVSGAAEASRDGLSAVPVRLQWPAIPQLRANLFAGGRRRFEIPWNAAWVQPPFQVTVSPRRDDDPGSVRLDPNAAPPTQAPVIVAARKGAAP